VRKLFESKIYMKSKQGENDFSMFINEQPSGGFKWEFLDFNPESEDYSSLYVHNFSLVDIEEVNKELAEKNKQLELSQKREAILKKEMQSLASCGTKHDLNPTGVLKACGCFDSFLGDNWQSYIKSQDLFVRQFAIQALKEVED